MKTTFTTTFITLLFLTGLFVNSTKAQNTMPEVLNEGTLKEQLEYLQERTRIYQDFRAIREDMFQKIKRNSLDSLNETKSEILQLENQLRSYGIRIDSLQSNLQETNTKLDEAIKNRDRMSFVGIPIHKTLYNSIMWIVIAGLILLTGILFLTAKRNITATLRTKKDLDETREEFETYRNESRIRQEQLVVKHHNELRKMKGK